VQPVAPVAGLGQQRLAVQRIQQPGGLGRAEAGQGSGRERLDGGARVQAQAAEEPLLVSRQVTVGHLERGGDAVVLRRQGEHAGPGLGDEVGQRPGRMPGIHPGQQRDRQRQEPGHPHQFSHCLTGVGAGPGRQPHEHLPRLLWR
jgi:hypothetical protein